MRTFAVGLLLFSLFAITFSRGFNAIFQYLKRLYVAASINGVGRNRKIPRKDLTAHEREATSKLYHVPTLAEPESQTSQTDLQKRYANLEGDGALLDAFARALEEGKLDRNDGVLEAPRNLEKRWWLPSHPWGKK